MLQGVLLTVVSYLFGSVASAVVVCRAMGLADPRTVGSGNPGATNVLRHCGKKAAALTLAGDFLKGTLPLMLARLITDDGVTFAVVGLAAFLGHLYPVFFGFKGGKGIATGLGVILGWSWLALLLTAGTWLLVALVVRISSAAALTSFLLAPAYVLWATASPTLAVGMATMTVITYWRHRSNIRNLLAGTEGKIGAGKPKKRS